MLEEGAGRTTGATCLTSRHTEKGSWQRSGSAWRGECQTWSSSLAAGRDLDWQSLVNTAPVMLRCVCPVGGV
jgi:hypothetical protein